MYPYYCHNAQPSPTEYKVVFVNDLPYSETLLISARGNALLYYSLDDGETKELILSSHSPYPPFFIYKGHRYDLSNNSPIYLSSLNQNQGVSDSRLYTLLPWWVE